MIILFFSIIFYMCFDSHWACLRSCREPGARAWLSTRLVIPCFRLSSNIFASVLQTKLSLPHPLTLGLTHCICDHPLDPKGIHFFLLCPWWGEDYIAWNHSRCFCVHCKRCQFSGFARSNPCFRTTFFSSFSSGVDIVLSVDDIHTLVDVVIVDLTWTNLVWQVVLFRGVAALLVVQVKEGFYCDYYLTNVFFHFVIEVFGCFYQQVDNFVHRCANMLWWAKGRSEAILIGVVFF